MNCVKCGGEAAGWKCAMKCKDCNKADVHCDCASMPAGGQM